MLPRKHAFRHQFLKVFAFDLCQKLKIHIRRGMKMRMEKLLRCFFLANQRIKFQTKWLKFIRVLLKKLEKNVVLQINELLFFFNIKVTVSCRQTALKIAICGIVQQAHQT